MSDAIAAEYAKPNRCDAWNMGVTLEELEERE